MIIEESLILNVRLLLRFSHRNDGEKAPAETGNSEGRKPCRATECRGSTRKRVSLNTNNCGGLPVYVWQTHRSATTIFISKFIFLISCNHSGICPPRFWKSLISKLPLNEGNWVLVRVLCVGCFSAITLSFRDLFVMLLESYIDIAGIMRGTLKAWHISVQRFILRLSFCMLMCFRFRL